MTVREMWSRYGDAVHLFFTSPGGSRQETFALNRMLHFARLLTEARRMTMTEIVERCAEACYDANKTYSETLGDRSFGPWPEAPEWQRESNRKGVNLLLQFFAPDGQLPAEHDPGTIARTLHESWCDEKYSQGWVYGPEKNATWKTHPCLRTYDELPPEQKFKDFLFFSVVKATVEEMARAGTWPPKSPYVTAELVAPAEPSDPEEATT